MTCEKATPKDAKQTTPRPTNTRSSSGSRSPSTPKKALPATRTITTCSAVLVTALAATPPRYAPGGSGVPRIRFSTPLSRRNTRLKARALNVVASTAIPAIPGTMTFRSSWLPCRMAPNSPRKSSGSRKLKNAALGLRQNSRRSSRYCRHVSARSDIRRQLQVDLLQRGSRDLELDELLAARQRLAGHLVQHAGRLVGDDLVRLAGRVPPRDPHAPGGVAAQLARRPLGEDPPVLDDRHAVGQLRRLVEVVRRQNDRLAQGAQRPDRLPRAPARDRIEAGRGLIQEDQLRIADQRETEIESPPLAARQLARLGLLFALEPDEREDLVRIARSRVEPCEVDERLAHTDVVVEPRLLEDDPHPLAQRARPAAGVEAEHPHVAARPLAVALQDLDRRRLARTVGPEQPEDLAALHAEVDAADGLDALVGLT